MPSRQRLGNWSFGDYFKAEAIDWAWELLTDRYGLDKDRLYVTVFGGDEGDGLQADLEAREQWRKHVPDDRILDASDFGSLQHRERHFIILKRMPRISWPVERYL